MSEIHRNECTKKKKSSSAVSLTCLTVVEAAWGLFVWNPWNPTRHCGNSTGLQREIYIIVYGQHVSE